MEKTRFEVYRLWKKLLRHKQTQHKKHWRFHFYKDLKWYLQNVTKVEVAYNDPPLDAIDVDPESFFKFIFRHLNEAL